MQQFNLHKQEGVLKGNTKMEDKKYCELPVGTEVSLTDPDGNVKYGYVMEYDNNTCLVKCEDGTIVALGG